MKRTNNRKGNRWAHTCTNTMSVSGSSNDIDSGLYAILPPASRSANRHSPSTAPPLGAAAEAGTAGQPSSTTAGGKLRRCTLITWISHSYAVQYVVDGADSPLGIRTTMETCMFVWSRPERNLKGRLPSCRTSGVLSLDQDAYSLGPCRGGRLSDRKGVVSADSRRCVYYRSS